MSELTPDVGTADEAELAERTAALVQAAATGDRRAAGEYFALNLRKLSAIAYRVAGDSFDPGDLLGEALLIVISKWADGTGPTGNVNAYIAKVMRNRMLDEFKSPRSQVRHLEPTHDIAAQEDDRIRLIELGPQLDLVRRALAELPPDQQEVLGATVVDGQKPRDLVEQLGRPTTAIYSLTKRAKTNLRRAMLRLMLEEDARPECAAAAQRLPENVGNSPDETTGGRSAEHYRTCRRCRRVWGSFAALAALGIVPLVVVGDLLSAPSASASTGEDARAEAPMSPAAPSPVPPTSLTPSAPAPRPRGLLGARLNLAGLLLALTGIALVGVLVVAFMTETLWFEREPTAQIDVDAVPVGATLIDFALDFEVVDETWRTRSLEITLSDEVLSVAAPEGWECGAEARVVTCATDRMSAPGGTFRIEHTDPDDVVVYDIELVTATDAGATVVGTASGRVRP